MYEVWNKGKRPYDHLPNVSGIKALVESLLEGARVLPDSTCPKAICSLIAMCHAFVSRKRPGMPWLRDALRHLEANEALLSLPVQAHSPTRVHAPATHLDTVTSPESRPSVANALQPAASGTYLDLVQHPEMTPPAKAIHATQRNATQFTDTIAQVSSTVGLVLQTEPSTSPYEALPPVPIRQAEHRSPRSSEYESPYAEVSDDTPEDIPVPRPNITLAAQNRHLELDPSILTRPPKALPATQSPAWSTPQPRRSTSGMDERGHNLDIAIRDFEVHLDDPTLSTFPAESRAVDASIPTSSLIVSPHDSPQDEVLPGGARLQARERSVSPMLQYQGSRCAPQSMHSLQSTEL